MIKNGCFSFFLPEYSWLGIELALYSVQQVTWPLHIPLTNYIVWLFREKKQKAVMREKEILCKIKDGWSPTAPFFVKLISSFQVSSGFSQGRFKFQSSLSLSS